MSISTSNKLAELVFLRHFCTIYFYKVVVKASDIVRLKTQLIKFHFCSPDGAAICYAATQCVCVLYFVFLHACIVTKMR